MTKHARMQIHTRMNRAVDWEVEIFKKRQEKGDDEKTVRDKDRGRSTVLSCICPLGLLLSSEPCVLNPSFESWPTTEPVRTHAHTHAYTQTSILAERARKQPENTLATGHFAKHNTLAHTHMHKHTQNSPFVGGGLSCAGTRDGRKVFCQASASQFSGKGHKHKPGSGGQTAQRLRHGAIC